MTIDSNPISEDTASEKLPTILLQSSKRSTHLEAKIAHLYEFHLIIDVFCPEMLELVQSYVQPRLHVSIEMDNSGIIDVIHANTRIIPKSEDMP